MDEREFRLGEQFFPYFRRIALGRLLPILVVAIAMTRGPKTCLHLRATMPAWQGN